MLTKNGLEECIQACWAARHLCQQTLFQHCLIKGGEHVAPIHVELMTSAIEILQASADALTRGSGLHAPVCAACANVCEACADSCAAIMCDDAPCPEMQRCADALRICAHLCRTMGQETYPLAFERPESPQPQA